LKYLQMQAVTGRAAVLEQDIEGARGEDNGQAMEAKLCGH
jgi:hypothetical protein